MTKKPIQARVYFKGLLKIMCFECGHVFSIFALVINMQKSVPKISKSEKYRVESMQMLNLVHAR